MPDTAAPLPEHAGKPAPEPRCMPGTVHWCRYDAHARQRSPFAAPSAWSAQGIGVLHAVGAVVAALMVSVAILSRLTPGTVRPVVGLVTTSAVALAGIWLAWWGIRLARRSYLPGTPAGPDAVHRVQCSASQRQRERLGVVADHGFEPELYSVWLSDAPRAWGWWPTAVAAGLGSLGMAFVNKITFNDPMHSAFVTLGLAGPAAGVAVLGIALPVEWKFSPGTLEIIRPGFLGLGWLARTDTLDLSRLHVFVDADRHAAVVLTSPKATHLRWDIATHRNEITRAMLLAAVSAPPEHHRPDTAFRA